MGLIQRVLQVSHSLSCLPQLGDATQTRFAWRQLTGLVASDLALREVSARIRPETALLRSLTQPGGLTILEQNFDFDLLTPRKLLEKYVGKDVQLVRTHPETGADQFATARVLAANDGVVLQVGDRIETGVPGRLVFPDVPSNLRDRPTLVVSLENARGGMQTTELSYLTGGLGWRADYVAELNPETGIGLASLIVFVCLAGGLIALGVWLDRVAVIAGGVAGLLVYLPWLANEILGEGAGAPIALLTAGAGLVGLALILGRRTTG